MLQKGGKKRNLYTEQPKHLKIEFRSHQRSELGYLVVGQVNLSLTQPMLS